MLLLYAQNLDKFIASQVLDIYLQYEEDQAVEPSIGAVDETSSLVSSSSGRRGTSQVPTNSTSYSTSPVQVHTERVRGLSTYFGRI